MMNEKQKVAYTGNLSEITSKLIGIVLKMPPEDRQKLYDDLKLKFDNKRREHNRRDYFMIAECAVGDRLHQGYIKNISPAGLFIEMDVSRRITPGVPITLTFSHPDSKNHIKTRGKIVRVDDNGVGVHLNNLIPLFG